MTKAIMVHSKACEMELAAVGNMPPERPKTKTPTSFSQKRESSASNSEHMSYEARRRGPLDPRFRGEDNTESVPTPLLWRCHHHAQESNIEAWVAASAGLETIAQTRQIEGTSARANAELIVEAVNGYEKMRPLITELVSALEHCIETGKLTWAAEQEADAVCRKAQRVMGRISS